MTTRLTNLLILLLTFYSLNIVAQRTFNHPGSILSKADLNRIKTHVEAGDEPWASCWKAMQSDMYAKSTYTASASTELGGSDGNRQRAAADAYAAMLNAIEWHITGKTAYANCAAKILTAWGNKLETSSAELYQYPCRAFIVAAEMLRTEEGFYEGWAEADRTTFLEKVRSIMVPSCRKFCTYQGTHPSWYTPCALAILAGGVLLDDAEMYQEGYELMMATNHWGTMYGGSIESSGQMREMGRDNVHGGLTLGDIAQACLVAWNQGDDMFGEGDNRLLKGMEYWCRYNTGHTDTPFEPLDCSGLDNSTGYSFYYISTHNNGFRLQPDACAFEAVYHHYKEVKGMDEATHFPYLGIATKLARPDNRADQMLGYGTLLFTINAETSEYMNEVPEKPVDVKAESGVNCIYLSWQHPEQEDARGFKIYRSTNGTSFTLLKSWDYYTNNEYKDEAVETGKTYYYKIKLLNRAGIGEQSDVVNATIPEATEELPPYWNFAAFGTKLGGGSYVEAQDSSFIVRGAGKDIGGTADSEGFVYKKITGDATLTVRLVSTIEDFFKVGIQMRSSLSAGAQRVGITLGEAGYRMLRTCVRSSLNGNTSWVNGTNYGRAPLWMRISREGNEFTTQLSRDGITWHQLHTATVLMPDTYYVGMASCSGSTMTTYPAIFDHVRLEGTVAMPSSKPASPTNFSAVWSGTDEATLTWSSVTDAENYNIYRLTCEREMTAAELKDADFELIATSRAPRYADSNATAGIWAYRVTASNVKGESNPCSAKQVTTDKVSKITGTVIGTSGSYGNNSSCTGKASLDGNLSTYYDAANTSGDWVGYDLGENCKAQVVYVKYAPRSGYPSRMTGGKFQAANKADFSDAFTIATVSEAPTDGVLTSQIATSTSGKLYRYLRYIGPDKCNCNVAEVQFYGRKVDETIVGIEEASAEPHNHRTAQPHDRTTAQPHDRIYDLNGRKMLASSVLPHGIYIADGKKVRK